MTAGALELPTVYLRSGEVYFTDQPVVIVTVLGSCVSVTMFHRRLGLSAVSHGLLPHCRNRDACGPGCGRSPKFVECSLQRMMERYKQSGVSLQEIESNVYGGAEMFGPREPGHMALSVGKQNVETAMQVLTNEGVKVVHADVGGNQGRKIYFNTQNGEVLSKLLPPQVVLADSSGGR